ncbi:flagellar basal body P-ring formation protein FlgA [Ciceribacter sp. L1K23]|uniref:flagellar basal body P-ring formation chaperone FlgA n=1 Tax=unclassified Ciceribacter TaxID=2628820 RepID=UPI001ABE4B5D|nr:MULTISPECIES: flagellar basal body P-ring formation chaperone FlgA [unclassified Ciceribacter]MBO3758368.1 flagellar basal body P-ring formation protein FlgA [Ciceribacter sp. L1K22]MBR0557004.1 flagellar basal body P-ring formation protein FlgA [Ciceribacter sp. L1K23]
MTFYRKWIDERIAAALIAVAMLLLGSVATATAQVRYAVVPTAIIYPGEEISPTQVEEVEITNPNLAGGYADSMTQVIGMVTKRTLLPGRTIPVSALREPFAVKRGTNLRLTFAIGNMMISAAGSPLQDAAIGDVIKVRNLDSGVIVTGTVMADGTVQVIAR